MPTLRWILNHKKTFLAVPLLILFLGLSVWLGIHRTLMPVEWTVNLLAREQASPELKRLMYADASADIARPLLELDQLHWQRVRDADGTDRTRLLLRRQDPAERDAETAAGLAVVKEGRILPGLGREFMPPLDEGSLLYMPSLLPQASLSQVVEVNSKQDLAIATVPEVESVVGKIGARRFRSRPSADRHDGIDCHPEARKRMAHQEGGACIFRVAWLAQGSADVGVAGRAPHHQAGDPR